MQERSAGNSKAATTLITWPIDYTRMLIRCTVDAAMLSQINGLVMLIWGCPNIVNCTVACP